MVLASPVDIQSIYIHKCFDEMWFEETHIDMFDGNVQDDRFALIAKMDENSQVVIKTPCGPTDELSCRVVFLAQLSRPFK